MVGFFPIQICWEVMSNFEFHDEPRKSRLLRFLEKYLVSQRENLKFTPRKNASHGQELRKREEDEAPNWSDQKKQTLHRCHEATPPGRVDDDHHLTGHPPSPLIILSAWNVACQVSLSM